jgi:cytochrome c oxidase subunit 2
MVVGFIFLIFILDLFPTVTQVRNPEASPTEFTDNKAVTFALVVGGIFGAVLVIGGGLGVLVYILNMNVARADAAKAEPANPLEYKTYGMLGVFALPIGLTVLLAVILLGFGVLPAEASTQAETVDMLFRVEFALQSLIFGVVVGLFLHAIFYFRAKEGDTSDGEFFHGNNFLELSWTLIPLVIVLGLSIWTAFLFADIIEEKEGEMEIEVTGQQWNWSFTYPVDSFPEEIVSRIPEEKFYAYDANGDIIYQTNENGDPILGENGEPIPQRLESFQSATLVLLIDQPVVFKLESADVIHSFWIPAMRVKQDVVPGVITEIRYTPNLAGEYQVVCTEMCGLLHSRMLADVQVLSQADYVNWLESTLDGLGDPIIAGETLWRANCANCHTVNGNDGTGPTWQGLYMSERSLASGQTVIADETYLYNSIVNPNSQLVSGYNANVMPANFGQRLSEVQIQQIIAFIKSPQVSLMAGTTESTFEEEVTEDMADPSLDAIQIPTQAVETEITPTETATEVAPAE